MISNFDQFSNCTAPISKKKSDFTSLHSSQLDLLQIDDNTPVTPWVRGDVIYEGMEPIDHGYVQKNIFGRRYYGNYHHYHSNLMKYYHHSTPTGYGSGDTNFTTVYDVDEVDNNGKTTNQYYHNHNNNRGHPTVSNRNYSYPRGYYRGASYYNNNNRSRVPFTYSSSSTTTYPPLTSLLKRSQSSFSIHTDWNNNHNNHNRIISNNNNNQYYYPKNARRMNHHYHPRNAKYRCNKKLNNEHCTTDEYIDDCLLTDIEQYQLKLDNMNEADDNHVQDNNYYCDINDNPCQHRLNDVDVVIVEDNLNCSSSADNDNNHRTMLSITKNDETTKDTATWNKVTPTQTTPQPPQPPPTTTTPTSSSPSTDSDFISVDISHSSSSSSSSSTSSNNQCDDVTTNDDCVDIEMKSIDTTKNDQKDCKFGNVNDYLTLVWGDVPETLETN
ncbi:unnamed protein product [Schistosoma turkestanicum]|nr:unnamed protein product [Schistosoma turkestanicum]CAH8428582.1 unnamed protein product [Schistosoma turkestanicum]